MSDLTTFINDIGGAANDLFSSQGNAAQANDFQSAAQLATQNAALTAASTRIQEAQTTRTIAQTLGTQAADVSGAGFTESGSALDLLQSSAQQGALSKALINVQGAVTENSYAAQAGAYSGEAAAAKEASTAGTIGAIASIGGALVSGTNALASADKTVAPGYNYLVGDSTTAAGTTFTGAAGASAAQTTSDFLAGGVTDTASQVLAPGAVDSSLLSTTDASISSGADLSGLLSSASTNVTLDTSGLALGTSTAAADAGITDALSSIGSDLLPGVGIADMVDQIPGVSSIPVAGTVLNAVSDASNAIVSGATDFISQAVGAGEDLLNTVTFGLSIICTAFYKQGVITRATWLGAQRYGQRLGRKTFMGYLFWATPIARKIEHSDQPVLRRIFLPMVHAMATPENSSLYGRTALKVCIAFSWILGHTLVPLIEWLKGGHHVNARA